MRGFTVFWGKEAREALRSGRFYILAALFLLLGISSPLAFKFLPQLLPPEFSSALSTLFQPSTEAVVGSLFKNFAQLGVLVLILVAMGSVAEEKSRGQLELVLARPVSTAAILWAKFAALALQYLLALALALGAFLFYTRTLFPPGPDLWLLLEAGSLFFLFGLLVVAFTLLASTLLSGQIWAALASGVFFLLLSFLPNLGNTWARYSPAALLAAANQVALGVSPLLGWWPQAAICVGAMLAFVFLAALALRRLEL
jgi:ABC-2 type transport system permease protein